MITLEERAVLRERYKDALPGTCSAEEVFKLETDAERDIPYLLDEIDRLEGEIYALRDECVCRHAAKPLWSSFAPVCPNCGRTAVEDPQPNHCPDCGQKIDWCL